MTLRGFVDAGDALSPRTALAGLGGAARALAAYDPATLWEHDTRTLPAPLAAYRRRLRDFARLHLAPHALTADLDPHAGVAQTVLAAAAKAGHLADFLPRPLGSLPLSLAATPAAWIQSVKMEELCAACGGLGLLIGANALGAAPLLFSGDWRAVTRYLLPAYRRSLRGEPAVFAFAITEPGGGSDVEDGHGAKTYRPGTVARRTARGWSLTGRKVFISGGDIADAVTVFAALEGEGVESWTCFIVARGAPGFSVARTERKMGQRASGAAELVFDGVDLGDDAVVGGLRGGWAINRAVLNTSRIPVAAIALGIARGAFESAVAFAAGARLGGRPLLDYQDVQLALAQMMIELHAMRATVWQTASRWRPTQARASAAKVFCGDGAVRVCERALDLVGNQALPHGTIEKAFRDARLTQIYEGTNQINRLAIIEDQLEELADAAESTRSRP